MGGETRPTLAELLSALSHALDLVEGQPRGHAVRTCLVAQRLAGEVGLSEAERESLFYAALLKDAGCSANSPRIQAIFGGDETIAKRNVKFVDWSRPLDSVGYAIRNAEVGGTLGQRVRRLMRMAKRPTGVMDEVTTTRCTRGAAIARRLGFDDRTAAAVYCLDEHWDGGGSPNHVAGSEIPIEARVLCLSQTLELFVSERGVEAASQMLRRRTGRWFEPRLARVAQSLLGDRAFWTHVSQVLDADFPALEAPSGVEQATEADVDQVCEAFAEIVDAKSGFTAEHSTRVTAVAVGLGDQMGFAGDRIDTLRRAALLHDIGKLGVSNRILDKPGKLDDAEWRIIREHPHHTFQILHRIRGFRRLAEVAANHHERLDGKGYPRRLGPEDLDLDMRILAVADVYDALRAERPYRAALPLPKVMEIMCEDDGLDQTCVEALRAFVTEDEPVLSLH